jgi:outer membrane protein assembly factor BamB
MPRDPRVLLFVGIKNAVVALDEKTGDEVWRTEVRPAGLVYVVWDGTSLYAASGGEVWRVNPESGAFIWHNELKGLGRGLMSLVSSRAPGQQSNLQAIAAIQAAQRAAAASAASG